MCYSGYQSTDKRGKDFREFTTSIWYIQFSIHTHHGHWKHTTSNKSFASLENKKQRYCV